jgi:hypothetical protein
MEMPENYRRPVASEHQRNSDLWQEVDLRELKGQALKNAAEQIFCDSISAGKSNVMGSEMDLREVKRRDPDTGHIVREYYGSPMSWMAQFTGGRRLARFNLNRNRD